MKGTILFAFILLHGISSAQTSDTLRIMPVGNSITAGEHYGYPAMEERTGYRKPLYEMLINGGYNVDFVGSQSHGIRPKSCNNYFDWNCEAYPGWKIRGISGKLKAALENYRPDILLIHVGTNGKNWGEKPGEAADMLSMIDTFSVKNNHPITVFLCLIINRFIEEDASLTSTFNEQVASMVKNRKGDSIKIILVDMENGANLDYTDRLPDSSQNPPFPGGDMLGRRYPGVSYDRYHPNDKGNYKMAKKFHEEIIKVFPEK